MRLLVLSMVVLFAGCQSITGPSEDEGKHLPNHPSEVKIAGYAQCYATFKGIGKIKVVIAEKPIMYPCPPPHSGECPGKGWAHVGTRTVTFWGPWVRGEYNGPRPRYELSIVAAHEVCHAYGHASEDHAELCATDAYITSDCN